MVQEVNRPLDVSHIVDDLCQTCGTVVSYGARHELRDCVQVLHRRTVDLERKYEVLCRFFMGDKS